MTTKSKNDGSRIGTGATFGFKNRETWAARLIITNDLILWKSTRGMDAPLLRRYLTDLKTIVHELKDGDWKMYFDDIGDLSKIDWEGLVHALRPE